MKIISWNARGIGGGGKVGVIRDMVRKHEVVFLGVVETKAASVSEVIIRKMWRSYDCNWAVVNAINGGGGLLCIWDKDFIIQENVRLGDRWICVKGIIQHMNFECAIVLVYGSHTVRERRQLWLDLVELKENLNTPVLIMGDFNEVLCPEERNNGADISRSIMDFRSWVEDMGLVDLTLIGRKFTWRRGNQCSKLDRVLVNPEWKEKFPDLKLWGVKCSKSDHVPLLVEAQQSNWGPKPFRALDV